VAAANPFMSDDVQVVGSKLQDYFTIFGLFPDFILDLADLEKRYFIAQRTFHPDRMAGKSANARRMAISQSMLVNAAYETLKSPLRRASYLLSLHGIAENSKPSHALLMEMMELREALSEAQNASELSELESQCLKNYEEALVNIAEAFGRKDLALAAELTTRLSYISKILDEIRAKKRIFNEKVV